MKIKLKNHFTVKTTLDLKTLEAWLENQVGERKARIFTDKGFKGFVVEFLTLEKFKSNQQNRTFWSLLDCFWESGCSSFNTYDDMVEFYYRIAGLITIKTKSTLKRETKAMIYKAIKILPLTFGVKQKVYKMLRGEYEKYLSWSVVKKKKATLTISTLMHDMNEAGVSSKKYDEILIGMGK